LNRGIHGTAMVNGRSVGTPAWAVMTRTPLATFAAAMLHAAGMFVTLIAISDGCVGATGKLCAGQERVTSPLVAPPAVRATMNVVMLTAFDAAVKLSITGLPFA